MKELNELILPDGIRYSASHEWVRRDGEEITVGITDYAQDQLGDIVYVELPSIGTSLHRGDELGTVESVKAVSEIFMPVGGEVVAVNTALADDPGLVNSSPYGDGWLLRLKAAATAEFDTLLDKAAYLALISPGE